MKGFIAICQHFHQPHFQLQNTREKVFRLSYLNWIDLLDSLSGTEGFYINMHFSGPFLYWLKSEKEDYLIRLKTIVEKRKIGIIGGYADEAFIQLSTRADDVLFQIKEYEKLTEELFHIQARDWQGFHIPERECGELLLKNTTKALSLVKASPIYYLDAETFFPCHYAEPGGDADYCNRLFGFTDPVSKTTIPHYPKSMLRFAFRDMIERYDFISLPLHCEERYWFLKYDISAGISPATYLEMIKKTLETALAQAEAIGKKIVPIVVIFEDAEKLGDWSGNPDCDSKWIRELVYLINKDEDVALTGLKNYCAEQGCFDTYPIRSSHSYIEWENWTAKRGIRGVAYGDEKIRKMVTLLHSLEVRTEHFERRLLEKYGNINNERYITAVMDAADRYECISELLLDNVDETMSGTYLLLQRIRNILYQEDSKWATRHPNYGSAPYLDNMGICLLEVAERILLQLESIVNIECPTNFLSVMDWMEDFKERIVIRTEYQTISINPYGANVDYHVVLNSNVSINAILSNVATEIRAMKTYPSTYRHISPVVFTETDSKLCYSFGSNGERVEKCRKSFAVCLSCWNGNHYEQIASFHDAVFSLYKQEKTANGYRLVFKTVQSANVNDCDFTVKLTRMFLIEDNSITVSTTAETDKVENIDLFLSTEVVTSLTASDEVTFSPSEGITVIEGDKHLHFQINGICSKPKNMDLQSNGAILFTYCIQTGAYDMFENGVMWSFSAESPITHTVIAPAVCNYYENYVGREQSCLGYTSSGVMVEPYTKLKGGKASLVVKQTCLWNLETPMEGTYISLVES